MDKIFVVIFSVIILTAPRAWAQEANAPANAAAAANAERANITVPPENMDNQEIVNDEGYGTDDEEYYGSEEDAANAEVNAEQPETVNTQQPASDNAVGQ